MMKQGLFAAAIAAVTLPSLAEPVVLQQALNSEAKRLTIALTAETAGQSNSGSTSDQFQTQTVPERFQSRGQVKYNSYANLGSVGDATYHLLLQDQEKSTLLSDSGSKVFEATILSTKSDSDKGEKVAEGTLNMGHQVRIPFTLKVDPIGSNAVTEIPGQVNFSLYGSSGNTYSGNRGVYSRVSLKGSMIAEPAKFSVTLPGVSSRKLNAQSQTWSLTAEPLSGGGQPASGSAALDSPVVLNGVSFVVEKYEEDLSEITLAVVAGDLADLSLKAAEPITELPELGQVELISRRLMSRGDLLETTSDSQALVLVFGDPVGRPAPGGPYQPGGPMLALPPDAILGILGRDVDEPPQVAFVVRQVPLALLYETYLNKEIPFLLLSDHSNPVQVTFVSSTLQPYYGHPGGEQQKQNLRATMRLPVDKPSLVAVDSSGKIIHMIADASELNGALLEMNRKLKEMNK